MPVIAAQENRQNFCASEGNRIAWGRVLSGSSRASRCEAHRGRHCRSIFMTPLIKRLRRWAWLPLVPTVGMLGDCATGYAAGHLPEPRTEALKAFFITSVIYFTVFIVKRMGHSKLNG